ncbi:hypothetical protein ACKU3Z_029885 [Pseudomonas aeruginosa]|nr:hypothetical protein [Pseudomonas aeruginosa]
MEQLFVASVIFTALILARSAYRAGLRIYGIAIGITGVLGHALLAFGYQLVSLPFLVISCLLILVSTLVMRSHKLGPYQHDGS